MEEKPNRWQSPQIAVVLASLYTMEWSFGWTSWPPRRHEVVWFTVYGLGAIVGDVHRARRRRAAARNEAQSEDALLLTNAIGSREPPREQ